MKTDDFSDGHGLDALVDSMLAEAQLSPLLSPPVAAPTGAPMPSATPAALPFSMPPLFMSELANFGMPLSSAFAGALDNSAVEKLVRELFSTPSAPQTPSPQAQPVSAPPVSASPKTAIPSQARSASHTPELFPELFPELVADHRAPSFFNVEAVRQDFPILNERVHGKPLIWLDNAATTQKPNAVIDRISEYYRRESSNIHRAAHTLAARSTDAYESARKKVAQFLNASSTNDIIFARGATEAINLVAQSWGRKHLGPGDEVLITWLEHHSNIVPWQQIVAERGARLVVVPIDGNGELCLDEYERLLTDRTKLVAITQVSNALGTVNPVGEMTAMAHRYGAKVLIDGAQAVSHMKVDVQALQADFYVFSGHKVFGPSGIGVLYGHRDVLATMPPWQGGGNMISDVTFQRTVYQPPPARFEAGTGNIADAVGLGAAIDYVQRIGMDNIARYEHELLDYMQAGLRQIDGLKIIGTAREKAGVVSFTLKGYRPDEIGAALDREGIAVRSGHHCAQPALRHFGLEASVRPSLAFYNTHAEIDTLISAVTRLSQLRN